MTQAGDRLLHSAKQAHDIVIGLQPRNDQIAQLMQDHLDKKIDYNQLCMEISKLGFKTTSVYEMVMAAEWKKEHGKDK